MVFIFACDSGLKSIFMPFLISLDLLNKELLQIESSHERLQSFPQTSLAQIEKNNRKIDFSSISSVLDLQMITSHGIPERY